jgi:hypothetical protein
MRHGPREKMSGRVFLKSRKPMLRYNVDLPWNLSIGFSILLCDGIIYFIGEISMLGDNKGVKTYGSIN